MEWISVKDRLPEHSQLILASGLMKGKIKGIALCEFFPSNQFYKDYTFCSVNEFDYIENVTHWMKLPDLPRE